MALQYQRGPYPKCPICEDIIYEVGSSAVPLHNIFGVCNTCAIDRGVHGKLHALLLSYKNDSTRKARTLMEKKAKRHASQVIEQEEEDRSRKEKRDAFMR